MASDDLVRQLQFTITDGSISRVDGTATPLGPWYSGISKHWLDYVTTVSGSSNFSISIATGQNRDTRIQEIAIVSYLVHPTLDFVLLQHAEPVLGARLPEFGSIAKYTIASFVGYGDRYHFGETTFVNDGNPSAFRMWLYSTRDSTDYGLKSSESGETWSIPGGGAKFDSSSPGYNDQNQLSLFLQRGTTNPLDPYVGDFATPFVESGLSTFIEANTPLNVPEPSTALLSTVGIVSILLRRKRKPTVA